MDLMLQSFFVLKNVCSCYNYDGDKMEKTYVCIDLKSFYASVECQERGLDPITTNLVVADSSRTEKTICLAVSPSLKSYGIPGRARLFEVIQKVKNINYLRRKNNYNKAFSGKSFNDIELKNNKNLELDFIAAVPRMSLYIDYSTRIYNVYLKYLAPEDIYVYSIDEVFCDITNYLKMYKMTPEELLTTMINDVYQTTGITATGGIGTNLYLCKVAMDIVAKHVEPDKNGVRIGKIDEKSYRELLWEHKPLTDFWRVGKGYAKKLEKYGMYTMGDIARCSINKEDLLYKLFGVNAELLIDHAWGVEPCSMADIKNYKPSINSLGSGQVLHCAYGYDKTKLVVKEMTDLLVLDLVSKKKVCDSIVLTIGYDIENLTDPKISELYDGEITIDYYGRSVPKHAHGTINLDYQTSSTEVIMKAMMELFERIIDKRLLVKRINMAFIGVVDSSKATKTRILKQVDLFSMDDEELLEDKKTNQEEEARVQNVMLEIKKKYGKNAILKGMNLEDGATTVERNKQIGGHKA